MNHPLLNKPCNISSTPVLYRWEALLKVHFGEDFFIVPSVLFTKYVIHIIAPARWDSNIVAAETIIWATGLIKPQHEILRCEHPVNSYNMDRTRLVTARWWWWCLSVIVQRYPAGNLHTKRKLTLRSFLDGGDVRVSQEASGSKIRRYPAVCDVHGLCVRIV